MTVEGPQWFAAYDAYRDSWDALVATAPTTQAGHLAMINYWVETADSIMPDYDRSTFFRMVGKSIGRPATR